MFKWASSYAILWELSRNSFSNTFTIDNTPVSGIWHANYSFIQSIFFLKGVLTLTQVQLTDHWAGRCKWTLTWFLIAWFLSGEKQAFLYLRNHRIQAVSHPVGVQGTSAHEGGVSGFKLSFAFAVFPRTRCLLIHWPKPPRLHGLTLIQRPIFCFPSREF